MWRQAALGDERIVASASPVVYFFDLLVSWILLCPISIKGIRWRFALNPKID